MKWIRIIVAMLVSLNLLVTNNGIQALNNSIEQENLHEENPDGVIDVPNNNVIVKQENNSAYDVIEAEDVVSIEIVIWNNQTSAISGFDYYLPVPKVETQIPALFGLEPYQFDMALVETSYFIYDEQGSLVTNQRAHDYNILYSNQTVDDQFKTINYGDSFDEQTTMLKIENRGMNQKEEIHLTLNIKVNQYFAPMLKNDFGGILQVVDNPGVYLQASPLVLKTGFHSISGKAFMDSEFNGIKDIGEEAIAGKRIDLFQVMPDLPMIVATTYTDNDGSYRFEGLSQGDYIVNASSLLESGQSFTISDPLGSKVCFNPTCYGNISINLQTTPGINQDIGVVNYDQSKFNVNISETDVTLLASNSQQTITKKVGLSAYSEIIPYIMAGKITWRSSNENIVVVDKGTLKGMREGEASVFVEVKDYLGHTKNFEVQVNVSSNEIPVINQTHVVIEKGQPFNVHDYFFATDYEQGNLKVDIVSGEVDVFTTGTYTLELELSVEEKDPITQETEVVNHDKQGNKLSVEGTVDVTVEVKDTKVDYLVTPFVMQSVDDSMSMNDILSLAQYKALEPLSVEMVSIINESEYVSTLTIRLTDLSDNQVTTSITIHRYDYFNKLLKEGIRYKPVVSELVDLSQTSFKEQAHLVVQRESQTGVSNASYKISNLPNDVGQFNVLILTDSGSSVSIPLTVIDSVDHYQINASSAIISSDALNQAMDDGKLNDFVLDQIKANGYYVTKSGKQVNVEVEVNVDALLE